ncbi:MAG: LacI family DNA-binding transcriptional regulator [Opitutales bacterium]
MVGLRQVAKEANVSITSASRVLNGSKRSRYISRDMEQRVREAARKLGYVGGYHRYALRTGKTDVVGLLVSVTCTQGEVEGLVQLRSTDHYHNCMVGGIEHAAYQHGYSLLLLAPETKGGTRFTDVVEKPIEGLMCATVTTERMRDRLVDLAHEKLELPLVLIHPLVEAPIATVGSNQAAAADQVLDHLSGLGHREVLWFGPDEPVDHFRYRAYAEAGARRGLHLERLILPGQEDLRHQRENEQTVAQREAVLSRYLEQASGCTAIVGWNDFFAGSASRLLLRRGLRIPNDISVVGHDNAFSTLAYPKLTSVDFQWSAMARRATALLFEMIQGGAEKIEALRGVRELFEPTLVVRESTGPVPARSPLAGWRAGG